MPFSHEGHFERSPRQEEIHRLFSEFRDQFMESGYAVPEEADAVVVLSAPPEKHGGEFIEKTDENIARVGFAIEVLKKLIAEKLKTTEEIREEDLKNCDIPLILNGETEQLPMMVECAVDFGFPESKLITVDCGKRGVGNTKTQFTTLNHDPKTVQRKHYVFVTTSYHVPRVARTALANLELQQQFDVIGVPLQRYPINIYRKVRGEVRRILTYAEKGDIASSNPKNGQKTPRM